MSPTIQNLHARTRDEGVCPSAGQAVHHSQLPLPLPLPLPLLGQFAGRRRVV